jgi:hypothetical protein
MVINPFTEKVDKYKLVIQLAAFVPEMMPSV